MRQALEQALSSRANRSYRLVEPALSGVHGAVLMALERWGAARTLTASIAVCTIGAALPLASTSLGSMVLSAALFGAGFFIPPAAVTALSQRALPREAWGSGVATYTVCFAAGQPIGPALAGAVADATGTLFAGLLTAVAVLVACCAIAALQKEP